MKRFFVVAAALAGLAGAGWWGYSYNRGGQSSALEISGKDGKADVLAGRSSQVGRPLVRPQAGPRAAPIPAPAVPSADDRAARVRKVVRADPAVGRVAGAVRSASEGREGVGRSAGRRGARRSATLRANETVDHEARRSPGASCKIGFTRRGPCVHRGALLVELDGSVLAAQAEQARAELGLARTSFERTEDLAKRNFVSSSARDQAAATLKVQAARLAAGRGAARQDPHRRPVQRACSGLRNVSRGRLRQGWRRPGRARGCLQHESRPAAARALPRVSCAAGQVDRR
jgi:hypothetical protein